MHWLKRNLIPRLWTRLRGARPFPLHLCVKRGKQIFTGCMIRKLHFFNTALYIVMQERPFSDLSELINLQKANGVKFEEGKSNDKACAMFITYMADVMHEDISTILSNRNIFAIAEYWSQMRKTGCVH